ncbi:hypothetical protein VCSRO83_0970 [Vibrio cholerae]|nr:hypothetical protein VCSRO83_0970 [Vibrio cholerae]
MGWGLKVVSKGVTGVCDTKMPLCVLSQLTIIKVVSISFPQFI